MSPNPYLAPAADSVVESLTTGPHNSHVSTFDLAVLAGFVLLLFAAAAHRCQLYFVTEDVTLYTRSPLIAVEIAGMVACLLVMPVLLMRSLRLFLQRRVRAALVSLLLCPTAFAVMGIAMMVDAPTLMYAT